jgi:hypothetical protein
VSDEPSILGGVAGAENLEFGQWYERGEDQSHEAFFAVLFEFLRNRLGGLPLELKLDLGQRIWGKVDALTPSTITLERGDESLVGTFQSSNIVGFKLDDEVLDRSDEMRSLD